MRIFYSGTDGKYGEPADSLVFSTHVMMTYEKIRSMGKDCRFWELLKQRKEGEKDASVVKEC